MALIELDGGTCFAIVRSCALEGPNLLHNSDFEAVDDAGTAGVGVEGVLPPPWEALQVTPDTYTTDGGFGIDPSTFGNFDGVSAHSGVRWVAAWSLADERGGQPLAAPLIAGHRYLARSWLHQAVRSDLNFPGTYVLMLAEPAQLNAIDVGNWCPTTSVDAGWVERSFTFVAPDAGSLTWLNFRPEGASGTYPYPGVDDFTLHDVTACPP